MRLNFVYKQLGQTSALNIVYIFKAFAAQSSLMNA